jgi:hypothetical protein
MLKACFISLPLAISNIDAIISNLSLLWLSAFALRLRSAIASATTAALSNNSKGIAAATKLGIKITKCLWLHMIATVK